jgi:DNA repair exonuclease SbcCD nuclease subunit
MIKILHTADWHLDSPLNMANEAQARLLRDALAQIPGKIAAICKAQGCDLVLLPGDLLDGAHSAGTLENLKEALREMAVPVFITPGNHDFVSTNSPWANEVFPENVHIFKKPAMESVALPQLDCRVYGAGFVAMDCPALLENFRAEGTETYHIGVFHGDPTQKNSPYNPISQAQVAASGLHYLALGHVHKAGQFTAGGTLCLWPGCPMGRGNDETGQKGVYIVTIDQTAEAEFIPLDVPRFYDLEAEVFGDPWQALRSVLPPVGNEDFYRVILTGECQSLDLSQLVLPQFPNLQLRDRTQPLSDPWRSVGEDSLEGLYFRLLQERLDSCDPETVELAAQISRRILDGREVTLP